MALRAGHTITISLGSSLWDTNTAKPLILGTLKSLWAVGVILTLRLSADIALTTKVNADFTFRAVVKISARLLGTSPIGTDRAGRTF